MLTVLTLAALLAALVHAPAAQADVPFNQKMLELVNQQRALAGIAPLQWSASLGSAAEDAPYSGCGFTVQGRAMDMGARNYFSHSILGCLTQSVFTLLGGLGIVSSATGENIAWMSGTTDYSVAAQHLMNDLMASPEHRANILNTTFTQVGIGSWSTQPGQTWSGGGAPLSRVWITAQIFGRGVAISAPAVGTSPTSLAFGDRTAGTSSPTQAVTVKNTGNAPLTVSRVALGGSNAGDFAVASSTCATVAPGGSCAINVAFAPGAIGAKSATLSITDDAAGSPQAVSLTGNGTAAPVAVIPGIPTSVRATGGDAEISATWGPAPSGAPVDGYAINLWDLNGYTGQQKLVCATCFTSGFAGLANGKQYYVTVYGHAAGGWSSPGYSTWTTVAAKPAAPTGIQASQGNGQMTATWIAPATPGAAIDGYGIFIYNATGYTGKSTWVCASCTTATVLGLTNGTSYYASVSAHNALGWGAAGISPTVVVGTPKPPTNLVIIPGVGQARVTWTAAESFGLPMGLYQIFAFDSYGQVAWWTVVCGTCTSTTATGLAGGRSYTIAVYPHNEAGWGAAASATTTVG